MEFPSALLQSSHWLEKQASLYANSIKPALVFTILKVFACHHKKCTQTGNPIVAIYRDNQALFKVPQFDRYLVFDKVFSIWKGI